MTEYAGVEVGTAVTNAGLRWPIRNRQTIRRVVIKSFGEEESWGSFFGFFTGHNDGRNDNILSNNVNLGSRWVVCVVNGDRNDMNTHLHEKYFDFPQSPLIPGPERAIRHCEAIQDIGLTELPDKEIGYRMNRLNGLWGDSYPFLWNNQYFAVFLAQVIIQQESWDRAVPQLNDLLRNLGEARCGFRVTRHLTCMGGMVVLGLATGVTGAFISWAVAGGSLFSDATAESDVLDTVKTLRQEFRALRQL